MILIVYTIPHSHYQYIQCMYNVHTFQIHFQKTKRKKKYISIKAAKIFYHFLNQKVLWELTSVGDPDPDPQIRDPDPRIFTGI